MEKGFRASEKHPVRHLVPRENGILSTLLSQHFALSQGEAETLVKLGAVHQTGRRILNDTFVEKGKSLTLYLKPRRYPVGKVDWSQVLVKDGSDFAVFNKPQGIPMHATVDNWTENFLSELRRRFSQDFLVTQRLDLPVGGLVVLAKTPQFQRFFNRLLEDHAVEKEYRALTTAAPPAGLHTHFMEPSDREPRKVQLEETPGSLRCEMQVKEVRSLKEGLFDCEVQLQTGRMHQLRAQLSAMGFPVVGDRLYGSTKEYGFLPRPLRGIGLFCHRLSWKGERFEISPPWCNFCE